MLRATVVFLTALTVLTSGCLGSVDPATIPEDTLDQNNWTERDRNEEGIAGGLAPATLVDYGPRGTTSGLGAGITVATTVNLPIVDERKLLPLALDHVEKEKGIEFANPVSRAIVVQAAGGSITATEYDIRGAPVPGKGLVYTLDCNDFAVVAAWGADVKTGSGGLFGGDRSETLYDAAVRISRSVTC